MDMKKVRYYKDGLFPEMIVRCSTDGDRQSVDVWSYTDKKWVPDANGWETVDDAEGHWSLTEEGAKKLIDQYVSDGNKHTKVKWNHKAEGAKRKVKK